MEAAVLWKAASHLPTELGKPCAFPTAPAAGENRARRTERDAEANLQNLTYTTKDGGRQNGLGGDEPT